MLGGASLHRFIAVAAVFVLVAGLVCLAVVAIAVAVVGPKVAWFNVALTGGLMAFACLVLTRRLVNYEVDNRITSLGSPSMLALPLFFAGMGFAVMCLIGCANVVATMLHG